MGRHPEQLNERGRKHKYTHTHTHTGTQSPNLPFCPTVIPMTSEFGKYLVPAIKLHFASFFIIFYPHNNVIFGFAYLLCTLHFT